MWATFYIDWVGNRLYYGAIYYKHAELTSIHSIVNSCCMPHPGTIYSGSLHGHASKKSYSQWTLHPVRYFQVPSSPTPTQTLTIQGAFWVALRWSVGQTTFSHSVSSWERTGIPVSTQCPSSTTLCWGATAAVGGSEAPHQKSIWQTASEGGASKATGGRAECAGDRRWDRALATWAASSAGIKAIGVQL